LELTNPADMGCQQDIFDPMVKQAMTVVAVAMSISCGRPTETTRPIEGPITESVYASGVIESKGQHEVYATVSGIVDQVFVKEGDTVQVGTPILSIFNEAQRISKENALLAASFADMRTNEDKLRDVQLQIANARSRMVNDSLQLDRQKRLWAKEIGSKVELEQQQLAYDNSASAHQQALIRLADLQRQLEYNARQSRNILRISDRMESDYLPRSTMRGMVYHVLKRKGEMVGPQTPLAIVGSATDFVLKMQVDEQDIFRVKAGQQVLVTLESYRDQVFEARVTKVNPLMNERNKTFEVEAGFVKMPERLLPNITFEANIIVQEKDRALVLPRRFMLTDSTVVLTSGDTVSVAIGLSDYQRVEIRSGLDASDEVVLPAP
jgi:multidrug efflux pump subunit AcrA (membrane-fusion protein)